MFYLLAVGNLLILGLSIWKFGSLPPQLPLYYSRPWGEDQLVDWWMLFSLPVIMNILSFFNLFFVNKFFPNNEFVSKIVHYFNVALTLTLTTVFIKILFLVT